MAHSQETTNYQLPIFVGTDKPKMADFNSAFSKIDTGLYNMAESLAASQENERQIKLDVNALTAQIRLAKNTVTEQQTKANATDAIIEDVERFNDEHAQDIDDLDDANDTNISNMNALNAKYNEYIKFRFGIVDNVYGYYKNNVFTPFA